MSDSSNHWLGRVRRGFAQRLREGPFWAIQAAVIAISALHLALEGGVIPLGPLEALDSAHHVPVIFYLIPVSYAGLVYGWEGGVLTALWSALLSSVNIFLFSLENLEWALETIFVVLVVGMGVLMSLPVERERAQRRRAENAVRRLESLNQMEQIANRSLDPREATRAVLTELGRLLELEDAGFVLWDERSEYPVIEVSLESDRSILSLSGIQNRPSGAGAPIDVESAGILAVPVSAGSLAGYLSVKPEPSLVLDEETTSFLSALGNQLVVRLENALLHEQEQRMWSEYVRLVTEAQEEERRRLARELHDGPAQRMAVLVRELDVDGGSGHPGRLQESASSVLAELRRLARDQRPTLLDDLGIAPALEWLVEDTAKSSVAGVTLQVQGSPVRLTPEVEVVLYRVAQEALRNAEQHSGASRIQLKLSFGRDEVRLTVTDDGGGFEVPAAPGGFLGVGRLGLMGMYERALLIGATLTIDSTRGEGTVVALTVDTQPTRPPPTDDAPEPQSE